MSQLDDRDRMVSEQIEARGIREPELLAAFRRVPRHAFVPDGQLLDAYKDRPLPIGLEQTISQPYMVAIMTRLLGIRPGTKVLEIGTGSGYQTALLHELGAEVYTVERHPELARRAQRVFAELGMGGITVRVGDGTRGWAEHAPYEAILVTAAGPSVPPDLVQQLADGGRLVMPVGGGKTQDLAFLEKRGETVHRDFQGRCSFVKLIGAQGWPEPDAD